MIWHNLLVHYSVVSVRVLAEKDGTLKQGNKGGFKGWTIYKGVDSLEKVT